VADQQSAAHQHARALSTRRLTVYVPAGTHFYKGVTKDLRSPTQPTGKLTYQPGTTVRANALDRDPSKDCAEGINFCRTLAEALYWSKGGTVVTVRPVGAIIDTGGKLRAAAVEVIGVAYLDGADLTGADLTGANLTRADLTGANLTRANARANLTRADLTGADLTGANLNRADLAGAYLAGANLTWANLTRADLTGANLTRANLDGVNLTRADLTGADLTGANLAGSKGDALTRLPDGWAVSGAGLIVRSGG
jgi:uncharacterized protein YjbI with pentapeptide repeats